jgi:hypothetical protein
MPRMDRTSRSSFPQALGKAGGDSPHDSVRRLAVARFRGALRHGRAGDRCTEVNTKGSVVFEHSGGQKLEAARGEQRDKPAHARGRRPKVASGGIPSLRHQSDHGLRMAGHVAQHFPHGARTCRGLVGRGWHGRHQRESVRPSETPEELPRERGEEPGTKRIRVGPGSRHHPVDVFVEDGREGQGDPPGEKPGLDSGWRDHAPADRGGLWPFARSGSAALQIPVRLAKRPPRPATRVRRAALSARLGYREGWRGPV